MYKKRISISVLSGLFVEILNKIAPLIILHVAQKRLGIEKLGYALFGISIVELVIPFILYGYNQYAVIAAGRNPKLTSRLMSAITILKFFHFLVLTGFLYVFFRYVPMYQTYFSLIMYLCIILGFTIFDTIWVQSASQKVSVSNFFVGLCRLLTLILILLFIKNSQDAILFAVLSLTGNALVNVFSIAYSVRQFGLSIPNWDDIRTLFKAASPYSGIIILGIIAERMDILFAEHFSGQTGAGYYACCARLSHSFTQIANTIIIAFFSEMVALKDKASLTSHMKLSAWVLLFFISPAVFGVWFVAGDVLTFVFDDSFRSIASLLGWLFLSTSFTLIASSFGQQVLLLNGQLKTFTRAFALGIFISSILAYHLGGRSLYAIAISMCIGKFCTMLMILHASQKTLVDFPLSILFKTLSPGCIMGLVLYTLQMQSFIGNISVGALVFLLSGYVFNSREYSSIFHQITGRLRS